MYISFYNLNQAPFQISSDPSFIWLGEKHKEALATLRYGILDSKGFLLLTGDVGTGKTTLINALIESLTDEVVYASVSDPRLETIDFFNYVAAAFGINEEFTSKGKFIHRLSEFLYDVHEKGKKALLIIDESQLLSQDLLEEIRLLTNINIANNQVLNIFFVGQDEFNTLIAREENRAILNRLTLNYQLQPLSLQETGQYIQHRLTVSGASTRIFEQSAVEKIFRYSGGSPRRINVICDHSLLNGYVAEKKTIDAGDVSKAEKDLAIPGIADQGRGVVPGQGVNSHGAVITPQKGGSDSSPNRVQMFRSILFLLLAIIVIVALVPERFVSLYQGVTGQAGVEDRVEQPIISEAEPQIVEPAATDELSLSGPEASNERIKPETPDSHSTEEAEQEVVVEPEPVPEIEPQAEVAGINEPVEKNPSPQQPTVPEPGQLMPEEKMESGEALFSQMEAMPVPETLVLRFEGEGNGIDFSSIDTQRLEAFLWFLKQDAKATAKITGHTDSTGPAQLNYRLSRFRAEVVKSFFIGKGVPQSRLLAEGAGPDFPLADNETEEGRIENRRVEVKIFVGTPE